MASSARAASSLDCQSSELALRGLDGVLHLGTYAIGELGGRHAEDGGQEARGGLCKLGLETLELRTGGGRLVLRTDFGVSQFLELLDRLIVLIEALLPFDQDFSECLVAGPRPEFRRRPLGGRVGARFGRGRQPLEALHGVRTQLLRVDRPRRQVAIRLAAARVLHPR